MTLTGLTAYDSTQMNLIPITAQVVFAYVDGRYANVDAARARFAGTNATIVTLTTRGGAAQGIDWEPGDVERDPVDWLKHAAQPPHIFYANLSDMNGHILPSLRGEPRSSYKLWTAHPTGQLHICGPNTCRQLPVDADGTQCLWSPKGLNIDVSLLRPDFFGPPPPPPPPQKASGKARALITVDLATNAATIHGLPGIGIRWGKVDEEISKEVQLGRGGKIRGRWREGSMPYNAPPLGK